MDKTSADLSDACISELARIEEDCKYSSKGHFENASYWRKLHLWLGLPAAVLSAISGISAFSKFSHHGAIAGILAFAVAALGGANSFLDPGAQASNHHRFGTAFKALQNRARMTASILALVSSDVDLAKSVDALSVERDELNKNAGEIPRKAFLRARKGIEAGEASYEIDSHTTS